MGQVGKRAPVARAQGGADQAIGRGAGGLHLQSGGQLGGKRLMTGSCPEPAARSKAAMDATLTGQCLLEGTGVRRRTRRAVDPGAGWQ